MKRFLSLLLVLMLLCGTAIAEPAAEPAAEEAAEALDVGFSLPLKKGDKGDDVTKLQLMLIEHNYLLDGADGSYGGKAVKAEKPKAKAKPKASK